MKKIGVIIIGIIIIGVGIFVFVKGQAKQKNCTVEAISTVVDIHQEESFDSDTGTTTYTFYPILEYKAGDKTVRKQSDTGSATLDYKLNDKIEILYNPNNVEEFLVKGDKSSNFIGIIFIVVGLITTIAGVVKKF